MQAGQEYTPKLKKRTALVQAKRCLADGRNRLNG
jgi:hypothetical protein